MNTAAQQPATQQPAGGQHEPAQPMGNIRPSKNDRLRQQDQGAANSPKNPGAGEPMQRVRGAHEEQLDLLGDPGKGQGKEPGEPGEPGAQGEPAAGQQQAAALTIKDLAARLEMKPAQLYGVEIPIGDNGERITLGELKDKYKELAPNVERLQAIDRIEVEQRADRANTIRELDHLVKMLPPQALSPEFIASAQQQMRVIAQGETQKLLQIFPDWQDPVHYQQAVAGMVDVAKGYGLTPAEVAGIVDSRWIQALHDLAQYRKRESVARSLKPDTKAGQRPAVSPSRNAAAAQQAATVSKAKRGDRMAQEAAVSALLQNL